MSKVLAALVLLGFSSASPAADWRHINFGKYAHADYVDAGSVTRSGSRIRFLEMTVVRSPIQGADYWIARFEGDCARMSMRRLKATFYLGPTVKPVRILGEEPSFINVRSNTVGGDLLRSVRQRSYGSKSVQNPYRDAKQRLRSGSGVATKVSD